MTVLYAPDAATVAPFARARIRTGSKRRFIARALGLLLLLAMVQQFATWPSVGSLATAMPDTTAFFELDRARMTASGSLGSPIRQDVPYEQISDNMKLAVLAAEDTRFFEHGGLDAVEIRASLRVAWQTRSFPRGASTITQQLARNLWLTPSRNPMRKMKETLLAVQLERSLSKRRILELYLNVVEFGPHTFGVEAAAMRFLGTSAADLTELQAAQLAAALPAPDVWYPGSTSTRYHARVHMIVARMRALRGLRARL